MQDPQLEIQKHADHIAEQLDTPSGSHCKAHMDQACDFLLAQFELPALRIEGFVQQASKP
jgi:hypothetical protein